MQNSQNKAQQGGFAMVMVLCIGALFVALATALLYASSLLTANANRQLTEQEVYGLASTFSARLNTELTTYDKLSPTVDLNGFGALADNYLRTTHETDTFDCFDTDLSGRDGADKLSVTLAKREADMQEVQEEEDVNLNSASVPAATTMESLEAERYTEFYLDVSVTAKKKDQSFTYTQSYSANTHFALNYEIAGKTGAYHYDVASQTFLSNSGMDSVPLDGAKGATGVKVKRDFSNPVTTTFSNRADEVLTADSGEGGVSP